MGRRTRTVPNSSRSVTNARPSGPPTKPPLRLRSISAIAPGGGALVEPVHDRDRMAGLAEDVGEARRLVRGEHDPGAVRLPGARPRPASRPARPSGRTGSRQPNGSPRRQAAAGHRGVLGRLRFPGQLERPRADEPALPVARRQVGGGPVLRQLAGLDELGPALVGLAPQERGGLGDVARLVEDERACPASMWSRPVAGARWAAQTSAASPTDHRAGPSPAAPRSRPSVVGRAAVSNRARSAASRSGSLAAARPSRSRIAAAPPAGSRNSDAGRSTRALDRADRPLVGRVERAQRVDLVAEELDPDRQRQRRREDVDDAAPPRRTRRGRRPR